MGKEITELLVAAQQAKEDAAGHEEKRVEANIKHRELMSMAFNLMQDQGLEMVRFEGLHGMRVSASPRRNRKATLKDADAFVHWLKERDIDPDDFKAFHWQKLTSFCNEVHDASEPMPAGVDYNITEQLTIRKS